MKKKRKIVIIVLLSIFLIVATIAMTQGKYIYNSVWNYYLSSKEFYFESDMLSINTKNNSLLKWDGSNVNFVIKNSLNNELISEYDISYKIKCEVIGKEAEYMDCILNDSNLSTFEGKLSSEAKCYNSLDETDVSQLTKSECELKGYTWKNEITSKNNYFNIILKDNTKKIDELKVKITAESITPYKQILSGIFNLNKVEGHTSDYIINYESYDESDEISITNISSEKKCISIDFDSSDYSVDSSSDYILNSISDNNGKISGIEIELEEQKTAQIELYKINDEKVYSVNDINVEEKEC